MIPENESGSAWGMWLACLGFVFAWPMHCAWNCAGAVLGRLWRAKP